MSGAGLEKLGEGLMQIGGNYINLTQKDLENKVEVIKQKTLSDMHSQEQYMKGTIAFAGLESEAEGRRIQQEQFKTTSDTQKAQFKITTSMEQKRLDQKELELNQKDKHFKAKHDLDTTVAHAKIDDAAARLAFQYYESHVVNGRLTTQGEQRLELDYEKLAELKRSHKVAEGYKKQTIELQIRTAEANMKAVIDRLALDRLKHLNTLSISERTLEHQKTIDHIRVGIEQGRLDLSENQLRVEQARFLKEFGLTSDKFEYDKSHTNRSFLEQRRQFNQGYSLKQTELKVVQARLALDVRDSDVRNELNTRQADLNDEIQALNVQKHELDKTNSVQERAYKEIMGQVAKRWVRIEEQKFTLDEKAHKRGQWKVTTRDIFKETVTFDEIEGKNVITYEKIGEEIVYVNLDDEGLHDVRILQNDGTWMFGSPEGANAGHQAIVKVIASVMKRDGISFMEARDNVQAYWQSGQLFKDDPYNQKNWDRFMGALLVVPWDRGGATTGDGKTLTEDAPAAANADGSVSVKGDGKETPKSTVQVDTSKKIVQGVPGPNEVHTDSAEADAIRKALGTDKPAKEATATKPASGKKSHNVGDKTSEGWVISKHWGRGGWTYRYSQEDPNK